MAKATLRGIMRRAHQLAKKFEGDYRARMSLALRLSWAEHKGGHSVKEVTKDQVVILELNRFAELKFYQKPQNEILAKIKRLGYSWNSISKSWSILPALKVPKELSGLIGKLQKIIPNLAISSYDEDGAEFVKSVWSGKVCDIKYPRRFSHEEYQFTMYDSPAEYEEHIF